MSSWKIPQISKLFIRMAQNDLVKEDAWTHFLENHNYFSRNLIITESLVQRELLVHNGKFASLIDIQTSMIGHKLGEFAVTKVLGSEAALRKKAKLLKKKKKKK